MSTEIQKAGSSGLQITQEQIKVLAQAGIIPANTPPPQIEVFMHTCNKLKLDPFTKEVHLVAYRNYKTGEYQFSTIVGIHGLEKKAASSGMFAGVDVPKFNMTADGRWQSMAEVAASKKLPISCSVTVYKLMGGTRVPFTAEVLWSEYGNEKNPNWSSRPMHMLTKVAKSHALRMAFPNETHGLHVEEEMSAMNDDTPVSIDISSTPKGKEQSQNVAPIDSAVVKSISNKIAELLITDAAPEDRLKQLNALYRNRQIVSAEAAKDEQVVAMFKAAKARFTEEINRARAAAQVTDAEVIEDDSNDQADEQ
jgi:phage recombination protein Bet